MTSEAWRGGGGASPGAEFEPPERRRREGAGEVCNQGSEGTRAREAELAQLVVGGKVRTMLAKQEGAGKPASVEAVGVTAGEGSLSGESQVVQGRVVSDEGTWPVRPLSYDSQEESRGSSVSMLMGSQGVMGRRERDIARSFLTNGSGSFAAV